MSSNKIITPRWLKHKSYKMLYSKMIIFESWACHFYIDRQSTCPLTVSSAVEFVGFSWRFSALEMSSTPLRVKESPALWRQTCSLGRDIYKRRRRQRWREIWENSWRKIVYNDFHLEPAKMENHKRANEIILADWPNIIGRNLKWSWNYTLSLSANDSVRPLFQWIERIA